jgi:hypothetical protein
MEVEAGTQLQSCQHVVLFVIPVLGQHQSKSPAEGFEDARLHQVAVEQVGICVMSVCVYQDAKLIKTIGIVTYGEVATELGLAYVQVYGITALAQRRCQACHHSIALTQGRERFATERIQVFQHMPRGSLVALRYRFGIMKEIFQAVRAVIVIIGNIVVMDGTYNRYVMLRTGENDVQALFSATLVDGSEVHEHPAIGVMTVTDAHDDDVALVTLNILEILYEQAAEYVVILADVFVLQKKSWTPIF